MKKGKKSVCVKQVIKSAFIKQSVYKKRGDMCKKKEYIREKQEKNKLSININCSITPAVHE